MGGAIVRTVKRRGCAVGKGRKMDGQKNTSGKLWPSELVSI